MKVMIADAFSSALPEKLQQIGAEITENKEEAQVILVRSKTKATKEYIDEAPNLKLIIRGGVGIDNIDTEYCKEKGIDVRNTPAASSVAVAELVFAHVLALKRHIVTAHNTTSEGKWEKKNLKGTELFEKTLGILGFGRIGHEVAKRANAFGMKCIAYDPFAKPSDLAELKELDQVLSESDVITLHMPSLPETNDIINAENIAKMKEGAIIINTGRGSLVDEQALADALNNNKLGGATLDVFKSEPLDEKSPLLNAKNILLTPHLGASTSENMQRIEKIIVEIIKN